jgi:1-acyl-sn-glycerol-3-phosphate acyltransferase
MDGGVNGTDKPGLGLRLGSGLIWAIWLLFTALWTPVVGLVYIFTAWWDDRRFWAGSTFRLGARILIALNPWWSCRTEGSIPDPDLEPFVGVSNHESLADIIIIGTLPLEMKWMSKASIFRIPFLGWMMRMAGDIPVNRGEAHSRANAFEETVRWIDRGASVMIFPEGTRSQTSEMLPFRNGAFRLAAQTKRPIQPIAVSGARDAIRKGSMLFGRADVVVRVLEPIPIDGIEGTGTLAAKELRDLARARIEQARQQVNPAHTG